MPEPELHRYAVEERRQVGRSQGLGIPPNQMLAKVFFYHKVLSHASAARRILRNERTNRRTPQENRVVEEEFVNVRKVVAIASLVLVSGLMAGRVRAGENDQSIKVTFSQPVMGPGHLLPAGTYWCEVMGKDDRQTVRILNEDQSRTCTILQTISQDRPVTSSSG